jgi:hypothetical protein
LPKQSNGGSAANAEIPGTTDARRRTALMQILNIFSPLFIAKI